MIERDGLDIHFTTYVQKYREVFRGSYEFSKYVLGSWRFCLKDRGILTS